MLKLFDIGIFLDGKPALYSPPLFGKQTMIFEDL